MTKINSRDKGARGEREVARILTEWGFPARRGQQFSGGPDSPDVICESLKGKHFEVKFVERGNLYDWLEQAKRDAPDEVPIVVHKRNHKELVAILPFEDFLCMVQKEQAYWKYHQACDTKVGDTLQ